MDDKDIESMFHQITEQIEFEEPAMDILELGRSIAHISEVNVYLSKLMNQALVNPEGLFTLDEDIALLIRELAGVSDELSGILVGCQCPACQGCECTDDEICEICEDDSEED